MVYAFYVLWGVLVWGVRRLVLLVSLLSDAAVVVYTLEKSAGDDKAMSAAVSEASEKLEERLEKQIEANLEKEREKERESEFALGHVNGPGREGIEASRAARVQYPQPTPRVSTRAH